MRTEKAEWSNMKYTFHQDKGLTNLNMSVQGINTSVNPKVSYLENLETQIVGWLLFSPKVKRMQ